MTKYFLKVLAAASMFAACQGQTNATDETATTEATETDALTDAVEWEPRGEKIVADGALTPAQMLEVYNQQGGRPGQWRRYARNV